MVDQDEPHIIAKIQEKYLDWLLWTSAAVWRTAENPRLQWFTCDGVKKGAGYLAQSWGAILVSSSILKVSDLENMSLVSAKFNLIVRDILDPNPSTASEGFLLLVRPQHSYTEANPSPSNAQAEILCCWRTTALVDKPDRSTLQNRRKTKQLIKQN